MKLSEQFCEQSEKVQSIDDAAKELYLLESNGRGQIEFHGPTMHPFLQDGDLLTVTAVNWNDIRVGDIITYRFKDKYPTYRVFRKKKSSLMMIADNWPNYSGEIDAEDVIGRVTEIRRGDILLSSDMRAWQSASSRVIWKRRLKELRNYLSQLIK